MRSSLILEDLNAESKKWSKTNSAIMNQLSTAEKPAVQKSSSQNKLEFLGKELANAQRRREALRLTMVMTGSSGYFEWNAFLLPPT